MASSDQRTLPGLGAAVCRDARIGPLVLRLACVISGHQTGVDRAGIDAARRLGLNTGGWVPRGRRAEDGRVPDHYRVTETDSAEYIERTRLNVRDSDATLVITRGALTRGSAQTVEYAAAARKPYLHVDLTQRVPVARPHLGKVIHGDPPWHLEIYWWLRDGGYRVLNVAGTRETGAPGIYHQTWSLLISALAWKERAEERP